MQMALKLEKSKFFAILYRFWAPLVPKLASKSNTVKFVLYFKRIAEMEGSIEIPERKCIKMKNIKFASGK